MFFFKSPIAHFELNELAFDHPKRVLYLGPNACRELFGFIQHGISGMAFIQSFALAWPHRNVPLHSRHGVGSLVNTLVTGVRKAPLFLAVQQAMALGDIVNMACHAFDGMHQIRVGINTDVRFHAEVPLVAFFARMHLGISRLAFVLCRGGRGNQGGIDGGAGFEQQAFADQLGVDGSQHWLG